MKCTLKLFKIFENVTAGFNLYCVMLNSLKLSSAGVHKTRSLVAKAPKLNLSQVIKTVSQIMQNNLSFKDLEYLADSGIVQTLWDQVDSVRFCWQNIDCSTKFSLLAFLKLLIRVS